jgi:5-methyltetrahydropteroyltriglutamate--homocysteine methyltransferase
VIDVASDTVETPQEVAEVIRKAAKYVPPKRLFPCTNCGMAPMDRDIAIAKLKALVAGAALASKATKPRQKPGSSRTSSRAGRSRPRSGR